MPRSYRFNLAVCVILINLLSVQTTYAQPAMPAYPTQGRITDTAGVITDNEQAQINEVMSRIASSTGADMFLHSTHVCGDDPAMYRNQIFADWQIGVHNPGLLILFCVDAKRVFVQTSDSINSVLSADVIERGILDHLNAKASNGNIAGGVIAMLNYYASQFPTINSAQVNNPSISEGATVPVNGVTLGEAAAAAERQREAQNPFIPVKKDNGWGLGTIVKWILILSLVLCVGGGGLYYYLYNREHTAEENKLTHQENPEEMGRNRVNLGNNPMSHAHLAMAGEGAVQDGSSDQLHPMWQTQNMDFSGLQDGAVSAKPAAGWPTRQEPTYQSPDDSMPRPSIVVQPPRQVQQPAVSQQSVQPVRAVRPPQPQQPFDEFERARPVVTQNNPPVPSGSALRKPKLPDDSGLDFE